MAAYYRNDARNFVTEELESVLGRLQKAYAADGFASQYTKQTQAWAASIPLLQAQLKELIALRSTAATWSVVLEYPLYRLRKRIDVVLLAGDVVIVIECKVGSSDFLAADRRQVEEYALDLSDFHKESHKRRIVPILWCTAAKNNHFDYSPYSSAAAPVAPTLCVSTASLSTQLAQLASSESRRHIIAEAWDHSPYQPVPSVIQAATSIFAGHDVRSITNADADNLHLASTRLIALIKQARELKKRYILFLSGVPGSGKTLAGLHVVHSAIATGVEQQGDIVYLSGNTPLVVVLREALARNEHERARRNETGRRTLEDIRRTARARIQHINDFLQQGLRGEDMVTPPHEHVIVFDEAQRAWDEKQGVEKFNRTASEPDLILELMGRHKDWCACICLVGGGQEINSGEEGVFGWGEALRKLSPDQQASWTVFAAPDVLKGGLSAGTFSLGALPAPIQICEELNLQLNVPQRSFRSPSLSLWVNQVLAGDISAAQSTANKLDAYPIYLTRSLVQAKEWLRVHGRGERRYGLLASSGARRLRADGIGTMLHATAGAEIAHWYLNEPGDIRSSFALEVPANEYTCQGLELDYACLCWGGDFLWDATEDAWKYSRLSGKDWQQVRDPIAKRFLENSYRVLLTRAREGMIIWIPEGDDADHTRNPTPLNQTAEFFLQCGAVFVES